MESNIVEIDMNTEPLVDLSQCETETVAHDGMIPQKNVEVEEVESNSKINCPNIKNNVVYDTLVGIDQANEMQAYYQQKSKRATWSEDSMAGAIKSVLEGKMGYKRASDAFNVPKTTLEDRVRKAKINDFSPKQAAEKKLIRNSTVFSVKQENELVEHILTLECKFFDLNLTDIRKLAFELAEINNIPNSFNKENRIAGKDWLIGFLKRHQEFSFKHLKRTTIAQAKTFDRVNVTKFYDLLETTMNKYKFTKNNIYNVDVTGIMTIPNKHSKVLALRRKKQMGSLSSAERDTLVTVETCMNTAGNFMPPMFIFPQNKENLKLMEGAPPGSFAIYHPSGRMQKHLFIVWFKKFIKFSHPSSENPVLLLLDGYTSYTKSIELMNLAQENHVVILGFPPHSTHQLQPLDVSFMVPLSDYYEQEVQKWLISNSGCQVTIYEVAKLFRNAYVKAAVLQTAIIGFAKTGIFPFNRHAIPDYSYAHSETTEHPITEENSSQTVFNSENENIYSIEPSTSIDSGNLSTISPLPYNQIPEETNQNTTKRKQEKINILTSTTSKPSIKKKKLSIIKKDS